MRMGKGNTLIASTSVKKITATAIRAHADRESVFKTARARSGCLPLHVTRGVGFVYTGIRKKLEIHEPARSVGEVCRSEISCRISDTTRFS